MHILVSQRWLFFTSMLLLTLGGWPSVGRATPAPAPELAIQQPVLKWQQGGCRTTYCRRGWYASPAVMDLDGDNAPEVIWTDERVVTVKGADGSDHWIAPSPNNQRGWPGVVVADIDDNGSPEIVTGHGGGSVSVYQATGTALPNWPRQPTAGSEIRSLAAGDVDANGDVELLICATRSQNQWFLLEHTGAVRAGWPVHTNSDTNGYAAGCYNQNVSLGDLDGDGRAEMIGPNDTHYVVGYNDDGTPLRASVSYGQIGGQNKPWARVGFHRDHTVDLRGYANCEAGEEPLEPRPNFADSAPSLADVNGDGTLEVIVVGNQYDCRTSPYTSLYHSPYILNADRTRWAGNGFNWQTLPTPDSHAAPLAEDYNLIETALPNPVVADLDGDGLREVLYASYDGRLHAYWLDRTEHGNWPFEVTNVGEGFLRFASEPVVADLDNDGQSEVIFTTWTQKGSNAGGQLILVDAMGTLLHALDLPRSDNDWDGALGAPTIANIDADADLEVVVGTAHMGLVAYDLPGTANARLLWPTGRGSYLRAGTPPTAACALTGDVNNDGAVTVLDIQTVGEAWRLVPPNLALDLDADNDVDIQDVQLVARHWGEQCG